MRRQFELSEEDTAGLDARGLTYEIVKQDQAKFLIIPKYPVPPGYNTPTAKLLLRIPPGYPDEQIDMVYFAPRLALLSGKHIRQLSDALCDSETYQQWSRHRTNVNPWRPGIDNICTHLIQVDSWLERER